MRALVLLGVLAAAFASECETQRQQALTSGLVGQFVPQCNDDGSFHNTQCHERFCFCVDEQTGERKEITDTVENKEDLEKTCASKCLQDRKQAKGLGAYKPTCEDDGTYHHTQCHGSVCFCVSQNGEKTTGSEGPISEKASIEAKCRSKCNMERRKTSGLGAYKPSCEVDGTYHHTQCHGSVCFCVNENGEKATGTEGPISKKAEIEAKCGSKCNMERRKSSGLGAYKPSCEDDGKYHHTQCHGSVCFCVDTESGEKKAKTEGPISKKSDLEKTCSSKCFQEQYAAKQSGLLGAFSPRCEDNGRYFPMQCRESSCFCVDRITGGKLAGTEKHISKKDEAEQLCKQSNGAFNLDVMNLVARPTSACEQERDDPAKEGLMGAFRPQCEESGAYKVVQCKESVCFCADPLTGKSMEGSGKHISEMGNMEKECMNKMSRCEKDRYNAAQRRAHGQFIAKCDNTGMYENTQCHGSVCFCVDAVDGSKIGGTEGNIGSYDKVKASCEKPACAAGQEIEARPGAHRPKCSPHGYFSPVQCKESMCFCVDRVSGKQLSRVMVPISEVSVLHDDCMTDCEKKRDLSTSMIAGRHGPSCNVDGSYHYVQCQEAVCGCADSSGNMIPATQKNIGFKRQLDRQCVGAPTACKSLRVARRWEKCPDECTYYKGYGEALVYCCCD